MHNKFFVNLGSWTKFGFYVFMSFKISRSPGIWHEPNTAIASSRGHLQIFIELCPLQVAKFVPFSKLLSNIAKHIQIFYEFF